MSFAIKRELYNEEVKNRFLNDKYPNEGTRKTYSSILKNVARFELEKNKDVYSFSYAEAVELLIGMKKKSFASLDVAHTIIMQYVNWAVEEKYCSINPFALITKDDIKKYIHKVASQKSHFSREQMYQYCDQIYNYIDKSLVVLFFESAKGRPKGKHTFEELRNLKKTDLKPITNTVTLTWDKDPDKEKPTQRDIIIDSRSMAILLEASEEEEYHKLNGEAEGKMATMPLKDTEYLLRSLDVDNGGEDRMSPASINTRFKGFRKFTDAKFINPTNTFQSGMIERCAIKEKQIKEEEGRDMTSDDFKNIWLNLKLDDKQHSVLKDMYNAYNMTKALDK